jgi:hypothetical protein
MQSVDDDRDGTGEGGEAIAFDLQREVSHRELEI